MRYLTCLALFMSSTAASASVSDVSIEIVPNGPAYLEPGQRRDVDIIIRNQGPDSADDIVAMTAEFRGAPIGDVVIEPSVNGTPCPFQYTDFVTPGGQSLFIATFVAPPVATGSEYSCKASIFAVARGVTFYDFRIGVNNITKGASDPNTTNNVATFRFTFALVTQLPTLSYAGLAITMIMILALTRRHLR